MNLSYLALKHTHITCVIISVSFFILRMNWRLTGSQNLQKKWVRIAPHIVDTVLLASAIYVAILAGFTPSNSPWLLAKIIALMGYIICGSLALKRAQTKRGQLLAFTGAMFFVFYLVSVAIAKHPFPFVI